MPLATTTGARWSQCCFFELSEQRRYNGHVFEDPVSVPDSPSSLLGDDAPYLSFPLVSISLQERFPFHWQRNLRLDSLRWVGFLLQATRVFKVNGLTLHVLLWKENKNIFCVFSDAFYLPLVKKAKQAATKELHKPIIWQPISLWFRQLLFEYIF